MPIHHTIHLSLGFIGLPDSHWKSLAKSSELLSDPMTRYLSGAWIPFRMRMRMYSVRSIEHHVCAADIQNICSGVYCCKPGSRDSRPYFVDHFLYALYANLMPPLSAMFSPCVLMPFICGTCKLSAIKHNLIKISSRFRALQVDCSPFDCLLLGSNNRK